MTRSSLVCSLFPDRSARPTSSSPRRATSAGLCLYPDRYGYRYLTDAGPVALDPVDGPSTVTIATRLDGVSVPTRLPEVVWRAGVDLHPLDVRDVGTRSWLRSLIWPEHDERRARLVRGRPDEAPGARSGGRPGPGLSGQPSTPPRIVWLSNEGRDVFPEIGAQVNGSTKGKFVLAVNDRAVALTGPHGQSYQGL